MDTTYWPTETTVTTPIAVTTPTAAATVTTVSTITYFLPSRIYINKLRAAVENRQITTKQLEASKHSM
jgi:hypothetical protein